MALLEKALVCPVALVPDKPVYIGTNNDNTLRLNYTNTDVFDNRAGHRAIGRVNQQ